MKRLALLAPSLVLIAACSGGASTSIQPGQWEDTVAITNVEIPGAPPEMANQMGAVMRQSQTRSHCVTPEMAANPTQGMANPTGQAQGCTFQNQTFENGTINVSSTCPAPTGGGQVRTQLTGTYTATTLNAQLNVEGPTGAPAAAGAPQTMRMTGTLTSRRTGDCTSGG